MRNLQLLYCNSHKFSKGLFSLDTDTNTIWIITHDLKLLYYSYSNETSKEVGDLKIECSLNTLDDVINLEYILDLECVLFVCANGELFKFSLEADEFENVGSVENGLLCAEWSPDQELVTLVSADYKIILLTKNCDNVSEFSLSSAEFGEALPVALGWGKRETQFKGKEGKNVDINSKELRNGTPQISDDGRVCISWRGDGQYLACSYLDKLNGSRLLKIFTRDCVLHATSELVSGLGENLSWKPSSNLITCSRVSHVNEIIFFEKNGLRHGEFTLPIIKDSYRVKNLLWNINATALLVWLLPNKVIDATLVQIWTTSNYHWYLKQEIIIPANESPYMVKWNPIHPLMLHLLTETGSYFTYEWKRVVSQCDEHSHENDHWIGVIDGCQLLLTPYKRLNIPPPMSSSVVQLAKPVLEVAFGCNSFRNHILCLLSNYTIVEITLDNLNLNEPFTITKEFTINNSNDADFIYFHNLRQLKWIADTLVVAISYSSIDNKHKLSLFQISATSNGIILEIDTLQTEKAILTLANCQSVPTLLVLELINGEVILIKVNDNKLITSSNIKLPYPCHNIGIVNFSNTPHIIGVTNNGRLFIDTFELCSNTTSYFIQSHFLLITTSNHLLYCVRLQRNLSEVKQLLPLQKVSNNEEVRQLERGAVLITSISYDSKVILQMPRGNLETIHPRPLILSIVTAHIDSCDYSTAYTLMRKHRINLNLLIDLNSNLFLSNIYRFIQQISDANLLNLFIMELADNDICQTMYPYVTQSRSQLDKPEVKAVIHIPNKVNTVCDLLISAFENAEDKSKYFLPILTALIKKSPSQLEDVLFRIRDIDSQPNNPNSPENAVKYVSLLIDLIDLYKIALGTYDFDIILLIAQQSQMDPKEYLPFLNNLYSLEENYRKFSIDCHLTRFEKALAHILGCHDKFDECLEFIQKNNFHQKALQIIAKNHSWYNEIKQSYGESLLMQQHFDEAGLIFVQIQQLNSALGAFEEAHNWRQVLIIANQLKLSQDEISALMHIQISHLKTENSFLEASQLMCEYTFEYEDAILLLIEGNQWKESYRLIAKHNRYDLCETHLKIKLLENCHNYIATFEQSRKEFCDYSQRLLSVLNRKLEKQQTLFDECGDVRDNHDLFSEQSSVTGQSQSSASATSHTSKSSSSSRSRKAKKKQERKKFRLKEGSPNEDLAILQEIREIIFSIDQKQDELRDMLEMLLTFDETDLSKQLQTVAMQVIKYFTSTIPDLWCKYRITQMSIQISDCNTTQGSSNNNIVSTVLELLKNDAISLTSSANRTNTEIKLEEVPEPVIRNIKWQLDL